MIRKGLVLGISRQNRHGQAWVFGSLLGMAHRKAPRCDQFLFLDITQTDVNAE